MTWKQCSRLPTASQCWWMDASSPRDRPLSFAPTPRCATPIWVSNRWFSMVEPRLLELVDVETRYGLSQVVFGITLVIAPGEMLTLMGRNGMGKTTTVRSIMGLTTPIAGSIRYADREIRGQPPHRIARLGIGLVPE